MNSFIIRLIGVLFVVLFFIFYTSAQNITGNLSELANQQLSLYGFNGLDSYLIISIQIDENGLFNLTYSELDYGVGYLKSVDGKLMYVILSRENIVIKGEELSNPQTISLALGKENFWFQQYAKTYPRREQALSAWRYLGNIYTSDSLFLNQQVTRQFIKKEIQRLHDEEAAFLNGLPQDSYVRWYLPTRKLISSVPAIVKYRTDEIPATIEAFRKMDYADPRLYKSGLLKDAVESHFWLMENSGRSLDEVTVEMQRSIDAMIELLVKDEQKLNEVTGYLFKLLERRSLVGASEYLALKMLNEVSCTINNDLAKQLEMYRSMKIGNVAPDFTLDHSMIAPGYSTGIIPKRLSEVNADYTIVVFGANWCPKCSEDLPAITNLYPLWKDHGMEVIFVSLDEDQASYESFVRNFPFISICDYKKWNSPIVQDYYIFATPTMYLLDRNRKILLRPNSVIQMNAWVDWYLVQGNR